MLILRRKVGEKIVIGDGITVVVNRVSGGRVTLGIDAPHDVHIVRGELRAFDEMRPQPVVTLVSPTTSDLPHVTSAADTSPLPR